MARRLETTGFVAIGGGVSSFVFTGVLWARSVRIVPVQSFDHHVSVLQRSRLNEVTSHAGPFFFDDTGNDGGVVELPVDADEVRFDINRVTGAAINAQWDFLFDDAPWRGPRPARAWFESTTIAASSNELIPVDFQGGFYSRMQFYVDVTASTTWELRMAPNGTSIVTGASVVASGGTGRTRAVVDLPAFRFALTLFNLDAVNASLFRRYMSWLP